MSNTTLPTTRLRPCYKDFAGYRSHRRHTLGGALLVVDAEAQGLDSEDGRWIVMWEDSPWDTRKDFGALSCNFTTLRDATQFAIAEASGVQDWHWGCGFSDGTTDE